MTHRQLQVAIELVAQKGRPGITAEAPGVILKSAQIKAGELLPTGFAEERILQFRLAIFVAKEQSEGVFWVDGQPAEPAANANAAIDLELTFSVRMQHFERTRALGFAALLTGIGIDAVLFAKHVFHDGND